MDAEKIVVPEFSGVAGRKLANILASGWAVSGYSIAKDGRHGFVTAGGFVGWWDASRDAHLEALESENERLRATLETLQRERDSALEAEDEAKDCFWAVYPTYIEVRGHGISTEAARTQIVRERDEAVSSAAAARANFLTMQNAANELRKERDEAREALDRDNDYLRFVARWAWRESEGLTDVERLSAIKYYPPIKALAAGDTK